MTIIADNCEKFKVAHWWTAFWPNRFPFAMTDLHTIWSKNICTTHGSYECCREISPNYENKNGHFHFVWNNVAHNS